MIYLKQLTTLLSFAFLFVIANPVVAMEPVNTDEQGIAIDGYDPVAYFTDNAAVQGKPEINYVWQGARWLFANPRHREMFARDPLAFAPRYGGFCSGGMASGVKVHADPQAWKIVDGKLYLAFNQEAVERFVANAEQTIPAAESNWQVLTDGN